jgi:hypothetical protein
MRCVVAISTNLRLHRPVSARDPLTRGSRGAILEYRCDRVESAWITQPSENEGDIAAQVPVVMFQPRLEFSYGAAIGGSSQRLADLELPPEHLLSLETIKQTPGRKRLHLLVGCDDAQPPFFDARDPFGRVAIAVGPAAVLRLRIDAAQG